MKNRKTVNPLSLIPGMGFDKELKELKDGTLPEFHGYGQIEDKIKSY